MDDVEDEIEKAKETGRVDLSHQALKEFEMPLLTLRGDLVQLNLTDNEIKEIPEDVKCFENLEVVNKKFFEYVVTLA